MWYGCILLLDGAIKCALNGLVDGIITCPLSKQAMQLAGFKYNGHTEILAEKTKTENMLWCYFLMI